MFIIIIIIWENNKVIKTTRKIIKITLIIKWTIQNTTKLYKIIIQILRQHKVIRTRINNNLRKRKILTIITRVTVQNSNNNINNKNKNNLREEKNIIVILIIMINY